MMFEVGVITNLQLVVLKSEYVSVLTHEYICVYLISYKSWRCPAQMLMPVALG